MGITSDSLLCLGHVEACGLPVGACFTSRCGWQKPQLLQSRRCGGPVLLTNSSLRGNVREVQGYGRVWWVTPIIVAGGVAVHAYNSSIWETETRKEKKSRGKKIQQPNYAHCPRHFELHAWFCSTQKLWVGEDKLFKPQLLVAFVPYVGS